MKIGQLNQHCGECSVIDYCAEPFDKLCLCTDSRLAEVEEEHYIELAEQSYESENVDICEDVISKLNKNCSTCEYWLKKYQQCEHPDQRNDESGAYDAPPIKVCDLWEPAID